MSKFSGPQYVALGCVSLCALATCMVRPLAVPERHVLPIQTFPITVGNWQAISEQPVETSVQERLPTARILDRTYRDARTGHVVDVMLLTATAVEDIHKPTSCLPAQGWQLDRPDYTTLDAQPVTILTAANQAHEEIQVAYWLTGYYAPHATHSPWIEGMLDVRNRLVGRDKAMSLFVRVIANKQADRADLTDFIRAALPLVHNLTRSFDPTTAASAPTTTEVEGG